MLPNAVPQFSAPPPVVRTQRTPPPPSSPKPTVATPAVEVPAVVAEPVPQLGPIFTPAQIQENNRTLDEYLRNVTRAVATLATKNLNKDQQETAQLVKNFLLQAEQARDKDLAAAVSLAKRADSLAKDLLARVQ
jgi:hypothetical protein